MAEIIIKDGYRITLYPETGDVIIRTEDYHAGELIVDVELAIKILDTVKMKTTNLMEAVQEMPDDEPLFDVQIQDSSNDDISNTGFNPTSSPDIP